MPAFSFPIADSDGRIINKKLIGFMLKATRACFYLAAVEHKTGSGAKDCCVNDVGGRIPFGSSSTVEGLGPLPGAKPLCREVSISNSIEED